MYDSCLICGNEFNYFVSGVIYQSAVKGKLEFCSDKCCKDFLTQDLMESTRINNQSRGVKTKCTEQQHDLCDGNIIKNSGETRACECQCHDYMYKLVGRMQAANNQT